MSCSVELLNWFESCCKDVEPQKKSLQLTANWSILPPDVVDIILDLLKQINFEFHTHNFQRIDKIPNMRFVGTPPQFWISKHITKAVIAHKQSLPKTLEYIATELEKRKQKSVDGNIKPSKMKCKYVKNIAEWTLAGVIYQNKTEWNRRHRHHINYGIRTYKINQTELIMW